MSKLVLRALDLIGDHLRTHKSSGGADVPLEMAKQTVTQRMNNPAPVEQPKPKAKAKDTTEGSVFAEKKAFQLPKIVASTDDPHEVADATYEYNKVHGHALLPIDKVFGGVNMNYPDQRKRVEELKEKIAHPEHGYVSRLIVDTDGNVVEGQHRFQALKELGATHVPAHVIEDIAKDVNHADLHNAIRSAGGISSDHAHQIAENALEALADSGSVDKVREEYSAPRGFERHWNAALDHLESIGKAKGGEVNTTEGSVFAKKADFIPHGHPEREENLAQHMEGSKTPPVLYHGTHGDITQFKRTKGAHFGFHFGDIEAANTRLEDIADKNPWDKTDLNERHAISEGHFKKLKDYENYLRRKNVEVPIEDLTKALEAGEDIGPIFKKYEYVPNDEEQEQLNHLRKTYESSKLPIIKTGSNANIGAYHVAIKNPLRMKDVGDWGSLKKIKEVLPFHSDAKTHEELINHLKSRGYDGIVYQNNVETPVMKTDSYIAFDPHQIKSAIGNNGHFDPSNPDITKAKGGEVEDYAKGGSVHPAAGIPGIHIVGHNPIFHGDE